MPNKRITYSILLFSLLPFLIHADVVSPYKYVSSGKISGSFELLLSLEKATGDKICLILWGGPGFSTILSNEPFQTIAVGAEAALEYRYYLSKEVYQKLFFGGYAGAGYMVGTNQGRGDNQINYGILGFGFKAGCKYPLSAQERKGNIRRICVEPYMSFGYTACHETGSGRKKGDLYVNFGFRVVLETIYR
jgi:hypothetical protein